ncbi:MAG: hypothetical protein QOH24_239 [Verrucomicrobiota bacterium]
MNTKKLAGEVAVGTGAPNGIGAAIAKLIRRRSVVDIVERFQTQHALQEEREMKNFHPLTNGTVATGVPDKNGIVKNSIIETGELQVSRDAVPRGTKSSLPHAALIVGRLRLSG